MSFLFDVWTISTLIYRETIVRGKKTWNIFNSISTYQHGISLSTEFYITQHSLQRVKYISLFSLQNFLMTLQTSQQFSTKASGVTLACCDWIIRLREICSILKMPEPWTQRQMKSNVKASTGWERLVTQTPQSVGEVCCCAWYRGGRQKMTASRLGTTLTLLLLGLCGVLEATISCRNEEGDAVDW